MTSQREPSREWLKRVLSRGDCPEPDVLFEWRDRALPKKDVEPLRQHVRACTRCQAELELLEEFESGGVLPHEEADVEYVTSRLGEYLSPRKLKLASSRDASSAGRAGSRPIVNWFTALGWRPMAGLAAALLLAVVYLNLPVAAPPPIDSSSPGVVRSGRLVLIAPAEEVDSPPTHFEWKIVPGAKRYSLELEEIDGTLLWEIDTDSSSVEIPAEIGSRLLPGKRVHWKVRAVDAQGSLLAESGRQALTVRRGGGS